MDYSIVYDREYLVDIDGNPIDKTPRTNPYDYDSFVMFKYSNFDFEFPDRYMDEDYVMPVNRNNVISKTDTSSTVVPQQNSGNNYNDGSQIILDEC